jgi:hypothetical protein
VWWQTPHTFIGHHDSQICGPTIDEIASIINSDSFEEAVSEDQEFQKTCRSNCSPIDRQSSTDYRNKHRESSLQEFYRSLDSESKKIILKVLWKRSALLAATTSVKKRSLSCTWTKKQRSSLTNHHLEDTCKTYTTNMTPECNTFDAGKRCNTSKYVCEMIMKSDKLN